MCYTETLCLFIVFATECAREHKLMIKRYLFTSISFFILSFFLKYAERIWYNNITIILVTI